MRPACFVHECYKTVALTIAAKTLTHKIYYNYSV